MPFLSPYGSACYAVDSRFETNKCLVLGDKEWRPLQLVKKIISERI